MWLLWLGAASAADFSTLLAESGWSEVASPSTKEAGTVQIRLKYIDGNPCLRGTVNVDIPAATLQEVVTDVPAAKRFSSETLIAARVLGQNGKYLDYYQHLDVPNWTMAADRYWVLRGHRIEGEGQVGFQWQRFDWATEYPDLRAELSAKHPDAVEPNPNYGAWIFTDSGGSTTANYYLCSNPGGSLPAWLQKAAATKTLPNTIADVMREGRKRAGQ